MRSGIQPTIWLSDADSFGTVYQEYVTSVLFFVVVITLLSLAPAWFFGKDYAALEQVRQYTAII